MLAVASGGAAIAGHLYPLYLGLKGGKGVATGAGVVFAMNWMAGLACLGAFVVVFAAFRYVSLGSILSAVPLAITHHFTCDLKRWESPWPFTVFFGLLTIVVISRHADNIRRLRKGEEKKFTFSRAGGGG